MYNEPEGYLGAPLSCELILQEACLFAFSISRVISFGLLVGNDGGKKAQDRNVKSIMSQNGKLLGRELDA